MLLTEVIVMDITLYYQPLNLFLGGLTEEYWKVVNKLKEWDNKREKEIEDAK